MKNTPETPEIFEMFEISETSASHYCNTWGFAQVIKHWMKTKKWPSNSPYPDNELNEDMLAPLATTWEVIKKSHHEQFNEQIHYLVDHYDVLDPIDPLEAFKGYMDMGIYPPPEVLVSISSALEAYFEHGTTLDEVFFGEKCQRSGSRFEQRHNIAIMREISTLLKYNENTDPKYKDQKIDIFRHVAEQYSSDDQPIEPRSLERRYNRFKLKYGHLLNTEPMISFT